MKKFNKEHEDLRKSSVEYITNFLKENGGRFEFMTQEEMEDDDFMEQAWQLPQAFLVNKYQTHCSYAITSVTLEEDILSFNGINLDDDGSEYSFSVYELDLGCLCHSADSLIIKEK
jgi:hypothetical protein